MKNFVLILSLSFLSMIPSRAQDTQAASDTIRKDALNVYMTTTSYIKKELTFINYVRDLKAADLYIIQTYQTTGSGGTAYTYFLVGQNKYAGMNDTIIVNESPDDTEDALRIKQLKALKMGLMRYMLRTPLSGYFDINFTQPVKEVVSTDKWKSWVFSTSFRAYIDWEESYNYASLYGSLTADHVTEKNKFNFYYSYNWNNSNYNIDGSTLNSFSRSQYASILYVKGLTDHWSIGVNTGANSSVYSNYDFAFNLTPAIEYDIFPYSQATRRQLRLLYRIGLEYSNYNDTTIYDKLTETLGMHSLQAAYKVVEKWGSINLTLTWNNYLHDWDKNNLSLSGSTSIRIAKGLQLSVGGGASLVHNQLSLVKGGATYEEMLLRRKEIASQYYYYTNIGLTYTFGSIYNNAVNPRFGSGSYYY